MKKKLEESLIDALSFCSLRELPPQDDGEHIWIKAIAKVRKVDNCLYYVVVEKNFELNNRVVKDFGEIGAIAEFIEYYPFMYLDADYIPQFDKKEQKIDFLIKHTNNAIEYYKSLRNKELDKYIIGYAIELQKNKKY